MGAVVSGDEVHDARRGIFWMYDDILDVYGAELGVYGIAVYALLCRRANARATCWPSLNGIARDLNTSRHGSQSSGRPRSPRAYTTHDEARYQRRPLFDAVHAFGGATPC
jgi:hypothetical protein